MKVCDVIRIDTAAGPLLLVTRHSITDNLRASFACRTALHHAKSREEADAVAQLLSLEMAIRVLPAK
jgi:hypothetical protein